MNSAAKKYIEYEMRLTSLQTPWDYEAVIVEERLEDAKSCATEIAEWWGMQSGSNIVQCAMTLPDGLPACDPFEVIIRRPNIERPVKLFASTRNQFYGLLEALDQYVEKWEFAIEDNKETGAFEALHESVARGRVSAVAEFRDAFYMELRRLETSSQRTDRRGETVIYAAIANLRSGQPFLTQFTDRESAIEWQKANGGEIWRKEVGEEWRKDEDTKSSDG